MKMTVIAPFKRPKALDEDALDKMLITSYREERSRRVKHVDDDFRNDIDMRGMPTGTFDLSQISMHTPVEEMAFNLLGGERVFLNTNYRCKHCGMEFGMAFPPLECPRCHTPTYMGELNSYGAFKR